MPGRKRTPAAQKIANGNPGHRPIVPDADFSSAGDIGNPPAWLDDEAKAEYDRIVEALDDMDILHSTDAGVLISYCVAYSRFVAAERQITKEGTVLKVDGSQGQTKFIKNPALMVSSEAQKQMLRAGALIGLNPIDRNRLSAPPKQSHDAFDDL